MDGHTSVNTSDSQNFIKVCCEVMPNLDLPSPSNTPSEKEVRHQRVLFVVTSNQLRGAEIEASQIHHELNARGWKTDIIALAPTTATETLEISCLGKRPLGLSTILRLRQQRGNYGVIVAYGSRTLPACALAFSGTRRKFIYRSIGSPTAWIRSRPHRARTSFLLRRAQFVVALWDGARRQFIDTFGCRQDSVSVIPNFRSPNQFIVPGFKQRIQARELFGFTHDDNVVLSVGALVTEKRIDKAILAVSKLPGAKLLVVGDGPLRGNLEALAAKEALDKVTFAGQLKDVVLAYHAADIFLLTSDTEGMPGALIEAGMTGLPMLSVDVGAVRWMSELSPMLTVTAGNSVEEIAATLEPRLRPRSLANRSQFHQLSTESVVDLWELVLADDSLN